MPTLTDEPTLTLLQRLRAGDTAARERLVARYLPRLTRWAHGRLPTGARDLSDTHDLVQVTLVRVLSHLEGFEHSGGGSLLGYLQQALLNVLRNEIRRSRRRGEHGELPEELAADETELAGVVDVHSNDIADCELRDGRRSNNKFARRRACLQRDLRRRRTS